MWSWETATGGQMSARYAAGRRLADEQVTVRPVRTQPGITVALSGYQAKLNALLFALDARSAQGGPWKEHALCPASTLSSSVPAKLVRRSRGGSSVPGAR